MIELHRVFLEKAEENLAAAQTEFLSDRYNASASRAYYSCYQAAIYALAQAGLVPPGDQWSHEFVQARFNGVLIGRQHRYPGQLRGTLNQNLTLRVMADYGTDHVTEVRADRAVGRAERFLEAIRPRGGESS
jgi:uncharacterized protein (UPF0332 family)